MITVDTACHKKCCCKGSSLPEWIWQKHRAVLWTKVLGFHCAYNAGLAGVKTLATVVKVAMLRIGRNGTCVVEEACQTNVCTSTLVWHRRWRAEQRETETNVKCSDAKNYFVYHGRWYRHLAGVILWKWVQQNAPIFWGTCLHNCMAYTFQNTHQDESFFRPEVLLLSQLVYLGPLGRQEELLERVLYNFVFEGKQILFLEKRFPKCTLFCKSIESYQQWLFSN
jgi:hypothetical protein